MELESYEYTVPVALRVVLACEVVKDEVGNSTSKMWYMLNLFCFLDCYWESRLYNSTVGSGCREV